jgi:hypothetical protein
MIEWKNFQSCFVFLFSKFFFGLITGGLTHFAAARFNAAC